MINTNELLEQQEKLFADAMAEHDKLFDVLSESYKNLMRTYTTEYLSQVRGIMQETREVFKQLNSKENQNA